MKYHERTYDSAYCCIFRKTRELYGGLSNMASGYPLIVNNIHIPSSEALYQACRYPHIPEAQATIIEQTSAMSAKMKSKKYYSQSRSDWEDIRVQVMRWTLRIKLVHNFTKFGILIESTGMNDIVEESSKDNFWGAFRIDEQKLVGVNALGRLLMELREVYQSQERYNLLYAPVPSIKNFLLMGREVEPVDERKRFIATILNSWEKRGMEVEQLSSSIAELDSDHTQTESNSDIKQEILGL